LNGATTTFVEPGAAAVVGVFLARLAPRRSTTLGGATVLAGTAVVLTGVAGGALPLLWIGGIIGGTGFGASFSGLLRAVTALAQPHERAELFAAVYVVAYLSFGLPAIIAGQLVSPHRLRPTVVRYGAVIIAASAAGLLAQTRRIIRRTHPTDQSKQSGARLVVCLDRSV
jgi:MFS family permease